MRGAERTGTSAPVTTGRTPEGAGTVVLVLALGDASYLDNCFVTIAEASALPSRKSSTIRPPIPIPTVRPLRPISICKAVAFRVFPLAKAFTSAKAERYYSDNLLPIEDLTCQSAKQPWEYQILPFSFFPSNSS